MKKTADKQIYNRAQAPANVIHYALAPTVREAVDYCSDGIISHPIGTGPIRLNVWRHGSYVELICNLNFRGELYPGQSESSDAELDYL